MKYFLYYTVLNMCWNLMSTVDFFCLLGSLLATRWTASNWLTQILSELSKKSIQMETAWNHLPSEHSMVASTALIVLMTDFGKCYLLQLLISDGNRISSSQLHAPVTCSGSIATSCQHSQSLCMLKVASSNRLHSIKVQTGPSLTILRYGLHCVLT